MGIPYINPETESIKYEEQYIFTEFSAKSHLIKPRASMRLGSKEIGSPESRGLERILWFEKYKRKGKGISESNIKWNVNNDKQESNNQ